MAKYKVGDKVRVRSDLGNRSKYYMDDKSVGWCAITPMCKLKNTIVTIAAVDEEGYHIKEMDCLWTDEMFEGLAEEKQIYKVGDRVIATDNCELYKEKPGTIVELWHDINHPTPYGVRFDDFKGEFLWSKVHSLIKEEPKPNKTVILFDEITIDNYTNACWYCRKGGLVDLYLAGAMGICPSCGRVCNNTTPKNKIVIEVEPPKRENKPLTTEELRALPDGTRVFTVCVENGEEKLKDHYTCWRVKKGDLIKRKGGHYSIHGNGKTYHTYLEMPEGAVDSGA